VYRRRAHDARRRAQEAGARAVAFHPHFNPAQHPHLSQTPPHGVPIHRGALPGEHHRGPGAMRHGAPGMTHH
jgi:hypothetical protein